MCKVSIIVPVYNVEKYLDRCLDSIVNQTLKDIEIILVEDGSPDDCPKICDQWASKDDRIRVIHKKKNEGLGYARNSGLEIAKGEYIAFVDSDDYVSLDAYEKLYEAAKKNNTDAVYAHSLIEVKGGKIRSFSQPSGTEEVFEGRKALNKVLLRMFENKNYNDIPYFCISVCNNIYKRSVIHDNSISFVSERDYISEDAIFNVDFLKYANIIIKYHICFYYYCYNEFSLSRRYRKGRFERDLVYCRELNKRLMTVPHITNVEETIKNYIWSRARDTMSSLVHSTCENKNKELRVICGNKELRNSISFAKKQKCTLKEKLFFYSVEYRFILLIRLYFEFTK